MTDMKMFKRILYTLMTGVMLISILSGCTGERYNVVRDGDFKGGRSTYREGAEVKLYYDLIATDTQYSFFVDNERINPDYSDKKGYIIEFVMPAHDVTVRVSSKNTMLAEDNVGFEKNPELTFDSFDGGGPDYDVIIDDKSVLSCEQTRAYANKNHAEMEGSSYTVYLAFTGLKQGSTTFKVECRSPIADNYDVIYSAEVNSALEVKLTQIERTDLNE